MRGVRLVCGMVPIDVGFAKIGEGRMRVRFFGERKMAIMEGLEWFFVLGEVRARESAAACLHISCFLPHYDYQIYVLPLLRSLHFFRSLPIHCYKFECNIEINYQARCWSMRIGKSNFSMEHACYVMVLSNANQFFTLEFTELLP